MSDQRDLGANWLRAWITPILLSVLIGSNVLSIGEVNKLRTDLLVWQERAATKESVNALERRVARMEMKLEAKQ